MCFKGTFVFGMFVLGEFCGSLILGLRDISTWRKAAPDTHTQNKKKRASEFTTVLQVSITLLAGAAGISVEHSCYPQVNTQRAGRGL